MTALPVMHTPSCVVSTDRVAAAYAGNGKRLFDGDLIGQRASRIPL